MAPNGGDGVGGKKGRRGRSDSESSEEEDTLRSIAAHLTAASDLFGSADSDAPLDHHHSVNDTQDDSKQTARSWDSSDWMDQLLAHSDRFQAHLNNGAQHQPAIAINGTRHQHHQQHLQGSPELRAMSDAPRSGSAAHPSQPHAEQPTHAYPQHTAHTGLWPSGETRHVEADEADEEDEEEDEERWKGEEEEDGEEEEEEAMPRHFVQEQDAPAKSGPAPAQDARQQLRVGADTGPSQHHTPAQATATVSTATGTGDPPRHRDDDHAPQQQQQPQQPQQLQQHASASPLALSSATGAQLDARRFEILYRAQTRKVEELTSMLHELRTARAREVAGMEHAVVNAHTERDAALEELKVMQARVQELEARMEQKQRSSAEQDVLVRQLQHDNHALELEVQGHNALVQQLQRQVAVLEGNKRESTARDDAVMEGMRRTYEEEIASLNTLIRENKAAHLRECEDLEAAIRSLQQQLAHAEQEAVSGRTKAERAQQPEQQQRQQEEKQQQQRPPPSTSTAGASTPLRVLTGLDPSNASSPDATRNAEAAVPVHTGEQQHQQHQQHQHSLVLDQLLGLESQHGSPWSSLVAPSTSAAATGSAPAGGHAEGDTGAQSPARQRRDGPQAQHLHGRQPKQPREQPHAQQQHLQHEERGVLRAGVEQRDAAVQVSVATETSEAGVMTERNGGTGDDAASPRRTHQGQGEGTKTVATTADEERGAGKHEQQGPERQIEERMGRDQGEDGEEHRTAQDEGAMEDQAREEENRQHMVDAAIQEANKRLQSLEHAIATLRAQLSDVRAQKETLQAHVSLLEGQVTSGANVRQQLDIVTKQCQELERENVRARFLLQALQDEAQRQREVAVAQATKQAVAQHTREREQWDRKLKSVRQQHVRALDEIQEKVSEYLSQMRSRAADAIRRQLDKEQARTMEMTAQCEWLRRELDRLRRSNTDGGGGGAGEGAVKVGWMEWMEEDRRRERRHKDKRQKHKDKHKRHREGQALTTKDQDTAPVCTVSMGQNTPSNHNVTTTTTTTATMAAGADMGGGSDHRARGDWSEKLHTEEVDARDKSEAGAVQMEAEGQEEGGASGGQPLDETLHTADLKLPAWTPLDVESKDKVKRKKKKKRRLRKRDEAPL